MFDVVADPASYPLWNSAVETMTRLSDGEAPKYRMERELPTGRAVNLLEIVRATRPHEVVVRASEGPTPFAYTYRLRGHARETELSLDADVELDGLFALVEPLARRAVKQGVENNLAALKALVESR